MNQKSGSGRGASQLLRPNLLNLVAAFEGTPIETKIRTIMDSFVKAGILGEIPEGVDIHYVTQTKTIDEERFNRSKRIHP